ncbi:hypothetical protein [Lysinibacillus xylanilyticus]
MQAQSRIRTQLCRGIIDPPADDVVIAQLAKGLLVDVKQEAFQL